MSNFALLAIAGVKARIYVRHNSVLQSRLTSVLSLTLRLTITDWKGMEVAVRTWVEKYYPSTG
jgi:hypothetical protein